MHNGHQHLLPADGIDLLADDLLHLGYHAPAQGQQAVDTCAEWPHHGGAQHQPVTGQLHVARSLTQGPAEEMGHPHTFTNLIFPQMPSSSYRDEDTSSYPAISPLFAWRTPAPPAASSTRAAM